MIANPSFRRKVIFLIAIVLLLIPLSFLSRPATTTDGGGMLAQMRAENNLSASSLGDVDPAGATMQLATLGLRGPAATILWQYAAYYQKTQNWDEYATTLTEISKIQPHHIKVWSDLASNLSYNISVEFDDYEKRYLWVKKGCKFFIQGRQYNRHSPLMLKEIGRFFGHKFGRSDERHSFRRMLAHDFDFHDELRPYVDIDATHGANHLPDNWLIAWQFYKQAEEVAAAYPNAARGDIPLLFYAKAPMQLMYYAKAVAGDGYFGEKAKAAWEQASEAWRDFGNRAIRTSWGIFIYLNDAEEREKQITNLVEKLDLLTPGIRSQIEEEKRAKLLTEYRNALDLPEDQRSEEQQLFALEAELAIQALPQEIAEKAPPEIQSEVNALVEEINDLLQNLKIINQYRDISNFKYWRLRANTEKRQLALDAHKLLHEGEELYHQAFFETITDEFGEEQMGARECYERAFENWAQIFAEDEEHILIHSPQADDLLDPIKRYKDVLDQLDVPFPPENFRLMEIIEINDSDWFKEIEEAQAHRSMNQSLETP